MKSERRHELHTNLLATWVAQTVEKLKPHSNSVLAVVLLIVLVWAAVTLWRHYSSSGSQLAWEAFDQVLDSSGPQMAYNPDTFEKLVDEFPRSDMAPWASATAGDLYLQQGCEQILRDKNNASNNLQKALDSYDTVLKQTQVDPLRERATFGVARAHEALAGTHRAENELQKAIEAYEMVVKSWPKGAYVAMATRRLEELQLTDTKRFYDKLAQYDPKPIFSDSPAQGFNLGNVPEEPGKKSGESKPGTPTSKPPAVQKSSPSPEKTATPPAAKADAPKTDAAKTDAAKTDAAPANKPAAPAPAKSEPAPAKSK